MAALISHLISVVLVRKNDLSSTVKMNEQGVRRSPK